jgi:hypothetical protein
MRDGTATAVKVNGHFCGVSMDRREFFLTAGGVAVASLLPSREAGAQQQQPATLPPMTVYKSPTCGCCTNWVEHAKKAGFTVKTVDTEDLAGVKRELGVPARLASCHTVVIGQFLVEGHVPAADVKRLLRERPTGVRGIAVPGMPIGSPGMEQGPPANYDKYDVIAFTASGATSIFAKH